MYFALGNIKFRAHGHCACTRTRMLARDYIGGLLGNKYSVQYFAMHIARTVSHVIRYVWRSGVGVVLRVEPACA